MRRIILLIAALLPLSIALSQELTDTHINKVDAQGRRQGSWRVYDGEGNLKFTGNFVNDKPVGEFRYFYPNGKPKAVVMQLDSGKVAYTTNYHPNGNMMARGKYMNQKKDSTWLYYAEEDGTLASDETYAAGKKVGTSKIYYSDGKLAEEINYKDDIKDGPWVQYFTDGTVKLKATYKAGSLEGMYIYYYLNGNVQVSGTYVNGVKDGTWVYLTDIGEMEKREEYRNGRMIDREEFEIKK
jgi:antitoxin component YwqK of YwqJK toxin-antitoxin module